MCNNYRYLTIISWNAVLARTLMRAFDDKVNYYHFKAMFFAVLTPKVGEKLGTALFNELS